MTETLLYLMTKDNDEEIVRETYQTFLGRPPHKEEAESRMTVLREKIEKAEFREEGICEFFESFLEGARCELLRKMTGIEGRPEKRDLIADKIDEWEVSSILEVGVASGRNAVKMIESAKRNFPAERITYFGVDFFSDYSKKIVREKLEETEAKFHLLRGDSKEVLDSFDESIDFIYIDGGHDYITAKTDWINSKRIMSSQTRVLFDDLWNPDVKEVVNEISREEFHIKTLEPWKEWEMALVRREKSEEN